MLLSSRLIVPLVCLSVDDRELFKSHFDRCVGRQLSVDSERKPSNELLFCVFLSLEVHSFIHSLKRDDVGLTSVHRSDLRE